MVDLTWSNAASDNVDIYRSGLKLEEAILDDGSYTDTIGKQSESSYLYKVCEAGTENCSNQAAVGF